MLPSQKYHKNIYLQTFVILLFYYLCIQIVNMTSKEFVQERFPKAKAEKVVNGRIKGMQEIYWIIRDGRNTMPMTSGKTESNAWVNAKARILEDENVSQKDLS
jgi:hypothetical protein